MYVGFRKDSLCLRLHFEIFMYRGWHQLNTQRVKEDRRPVTDSPKDKSLGGEVNMEVYVTSLFPFPSGFRPL